MMWFILLYQSFILDKDPVLKSKHYRSSLHRFYGLYLAYITTEIDRLHNLKKKLPTLRIRILGVV